MGTGTAAAVPAFELPRSVRLSRVGDDLLARYIARGSERAFTALYERYHQQLYRYCRSILRTDADAQDALQTTFAGALAAIREGRRNAPVRPWLYRIAHNEAISILRQRRREREAPASTGRVVEASAEEHVAQRARWQALMSDIGRLPDRQRSALVLRELSGLSHDEIAIALDTTAGGAKQAIFEARQALSELEEGRAMSCDEVCRRLSDGDRRVVRGRRVAAHLRACPGCAAFAAAMSTRRSDLRAFMPVLPPTMAAALLSRSIHAASIPGSGGIAGVGTAATGAAATGGAASGAVGTGGAVAGSVATGGAAAGGTVSIGAAAAGTAIATKAIAVTVVVATAAAGATGLSGVLSAHHARIRGPVSHRGHQPSVAAGVSSGSARASTVAGAGAASSSRAAAGSSGAVLPAGSARGRRAKPSQIATSHAHAGAAHAAGGSSHAGSGSRGRSGSAGPDAGGRNGTGQAHQPPSASSGRSGAPADPNPGGGHANAGGGSSGTNGLGHSSGGGSSGVPELPVSSPGNSGAHTPGGVNGPAHAHQ